MLQHESKKSKEKKQDDKVDKKGEGGGGGGGGEEEEEEEEEEEKKKEKKASNLRCIKDSCIQLFVHGRSKQNIVLQRLVLNPVLLSNERDLRVEALEAFDAPHLPEHCGH